MENEEIDLFDYPELIPENVKKVLDKLGEQPDYCDLNRIQLEVEELGYTFDYGLDASPFELRKIN